MAKTLSPGHLYHDGKPVWVDDREPILYTVPFDGAELYVRKENNEMTDDELNRELPPSEWQFGTATDYPNLNLISREGLIDMLEESEQLREEQADVIAARDAEIERLKTRFYKAAISNHRARSDNLLSDHYGVSFDNCDGVFCKEARELVSK